MPQKDLEKPCHGYPALANFMFNNPGFESFQAFRDLHVKSLLYYQVKLDTIRNQLHKLEWEDHCNGTFEHHEILSKDAGYLLKTETKAAEGGTAAAGNIGGAGSTESAGGGRAEDRQSAQIRKVEEMRKVLKDYSEALLLYTKINDLPKPEKFRVKNLLKWLQAKDTEFPIQGRGANSWGELTKESPTKGSVLSHFFRLVRTIFWSKEEDEIQLDLVVPLTNKTADGLTKWIESEGVPFWARVCDALKKKKYILPCTREPPPSKRSSISSDTSFARFFFRRKMFDEKTVSENSEDYTRDAKIKIVTYKYRTLLAFTTFVTTVFASLLPIVAIVVLSKIHKQSMVLGFIALFTGLFTMGLMMLTPPGTKRTEIFTASAAFAAVMVVFVQNQTGGNGS